MQAGKLDRRIVIRRYTETRDAFNNPVQTWADLAERWASKQDVSDGERWSAQEVGAEVTTRFQVRSDSVTRTINAKDRIAYDGETYDISGVKELGRREGVEITAVRRGD